MGGTNTRKARRTQHTERSGNMAGPAQGVSVAQMTDRGLLAQSSAAGIIIVKTRQKNAD